MKLADFDFPLPPELIAQEPAPRRDGARLMVLPREGPPEHRIFTDLPALLRPGDLLVLNDTRVIPSRLMLRRVTGGRVDALLLREIDGRRWEALLDTSRKLAVGERLKVEDRLEAAIAGRTEDGKWVLEFGAEVGPLLARLGRPPLPPYIRREARDDDRERYQTVYAAREGAIAAPTAGLHFTPEMLRSLEGTVEIVRITLHVGLGTFKPVKVENIDDHRMDPEAYEITPDAEARLRKARAEGRRIVAVGTTSCRTLESWARSGRPSGTTGLFIRPPFEFKVTDVLLTNFHTPRSTLLMLVSAFSGRERILAAYAEAVRLRYRFFSYGDATLLL